MPLTNPPTAPQTTDPATFAARADALVAWYATNVTELGVLQTDVASKQSTASSAASTATTQAGIATTGAGTATTQAGIAMTAAASATGAPGTSATSATSLAIGTGVKALTIQTGKLFAVGQTIVIADTSTPTNQMVGTVSTHDNTTGALTVSVTKTGGSGTIAAWTVSVSGPVGASGAVTLGRTVQTVDYTILSSDLGKEIVLTGATSRTFTTPAAATVGAGWYCYVQNGGNDTTTGTNPVALTIDGNASETIDGALTVVEYMGGTLLLITDGANWYATRISAGFARFTQTGTLIFPTKVSGWRVECYGAGGGGSGAGTPGYPGAGGGGGAMTPRDHSGIAVNTAVTATIGAGGTGGSASAGASIPSGTAGGFTELVGYCKAYGGNFGGNGGGGGGGGQASINATSYYGGSPNANTMGAAVPNNVGGGGAASGGHAEYGGGGGNGGSSMFAGGGGGTSSTNGGANGAYTTGGGGNSPGGTAGTNGSAGTSRTIGAGDGGGGGAQNAGATGGSGGAGGIPSGGGGGAGYGATTGGVGGAGARGEIRVWYR